MQAVARVERNDVEHLRFIKGKREGDAFPKQGRPRKLPAPKQEGRIAHTASDELASRLTELELSRLAIEMPEPNSASNAVLRAYAED